MLLTEYQELAMRTNGNTGQRLVIEQDDAILLNAALGLAGEAGEFVDALKKYLFHGHPFDYDYFVKELGDLAWYLAQAAEALDIGLDTICRINIDKLAKRYPEGFTSEASINRS